MAENNYTKYDEDFKNLSSLSIKTENHKPSSTKTTAFQNPPSPNG